MNLLLYQMCFDLSGMIPISSVLELMAGWFTRSDTVKATCSIVGYRRIKLSRWSPHSLTMG